MTMSREATGSIQRYRDVADRWRWRLVGADGHVLADGTTDHDDAAALDAHLDALARRLDGAVVATLPAGATVRQGDRHHRLDASGELQAAASDPPVDDPPDAPVLTADAVAACHRGHDEEWRWTLLAGGPVAESGEGYATARRAHAMAERSLALLPAAERTTWGEPQNV